MKTKHVLIVVALLAVGVYVGTHYMQASRGIPPSDGTAGGSTAAGAKDLGLKKSLAGSKAVVEAAKTGALGATQAAGRTEEKKQKQV